MLGDRLLRESEGEHRSDKSAPEAPEVADGDDLHSTPLVCGRGVDLPGASRLEEVRGENRALHRARVGPVIAQTLPDEPDRPRVAFSHHREVLACFVDLKVLGVDIGPQLGSPRRKVPRGLKDPVGGHRRVVDNVHRRHANRLCGGRGVEKSGR